tara:strand:- start:119 stop:580 length:462 start_codon:yes stop_codon:yes gene_type:complete
MINLFKITILFFFIILASCGYKPIFSAKNSNFAITEIKFVGEKNIASKIGNNLKIYKNTKNKEQFYTLEIFSNKEKNIVSKDSKGNPIIFETKISVDLTVLENGEVKNTKAIIKSFTYNNSSNKFSLKQYEKDIENNLISEIASTIILHLHSI